VRVLVAGGGVAALETILALRALAGPRVSIEQLAPDPSFLDRPSSVATAFGFGAADPLPLEVVARRERVALLRDAIARVEPDRHRVLTAAGRRLTYDALVIATGGRSRAVLPGALPFTGPADVEPLAAVLERAVRGEVRRLAFALPPGVSWSLPLYELAIMAAIQLRHRIMSDTQITVVTPERRPLWLFGTAGADALERLLTERDVALRTETRAVTVEHDALLLAGGERLPADAVVALPALTGPGIDGLPTDGHGFLPVDPHGRVVGAADVYAAGDATAFPVKQGGLATQQADAVAEAIAATLGTIERPARFRPVLRGLLLTGGAPLYLRAELSAAGALLDARGTPLPTTRGETSTRALWWPPAKVAGRYLGPYLASARPRALAAEPLRDRTPIATSAPPDTDDAFLLAVLVAEEDARLCDYGQALQALDAAAALRGGLLPTDLAERRANWAVRAGEAPTRSPAPAA
jgi:sulfide:quinone oxidoreductase